MQPKYTWKRALLDLTLFWLTCGLNLVYKLFKYMYQRSH
jgi:hypothetical protein